MPLTFLAHQVPVLPLKLRWPHLVDGTALVIGSMVPDLLFFLHGTDVSIDAHAVPAQFWLCLPLTIVLTGLTKRVVAGVLGPHLPDAGSFHLRDYARLSQWTVPRSARRWAVLVLSALAGSFSHLLMDSFTHSWGFVAENVGVLHVPLFNLPAWMPGALSGRLLYTYDLLQVIGSFAGAVVALGVLRMIGQRRLLVTTYPDAAASTPSLQATPTSLRRLVAWVGGGALAGVVLSFGAASLLGTRHSLLFRVIDAAYIGLVIGSIHAKSAMVMPSRRHTTELPEKLVTEPATSR